MGLTLDVTGLQSLPSVVTDEVEGLSRKKKSRGGHGGGGGGSTTNLCLITLNNVLNDLDVLNIFGGGFGL